MFITDSFSAVRNSITAHCLNHTSPYHTTSATPAQAKENILSRISAAASRKFKIHHHQSGVTFQCGPWPSTQSSSNPLEFRSSLTNLGCSSSRDPPPRLISSIFCLIILVSSCHRFLLSGSF